MPQVAIRLTDRDGVLVNPHTAEREMPSFPSYSADLMTEEEREADRATMQVRSGSHIEAE